MTWLVRRVEHLASEVRTTVDPETLGDVEVDHYSIPALDATGLPERQAASEIQSNKQLLRGGEILVSRLNPRKARVLIVPPLGDRPALASGEFVVLSPFDVDARYFVYALLSETTRQNLDGSVQSVTRSHQRIRPEQLLKMGLKVPEVTAEQRSIADFLDAETARIDALMAKKRRLIDRLEERWLAELRASLRVEGVAPESGVLTLSLPAGWEVRPLRHLVERVWGGDWGSEAGEQQVDASCVRAADFNFRRIQANSGALRSFSRAAVAARGLASGDLVIEKSGGGEGVPVGRVVSWQGQLPAVPTNFAGGLRPSRDASGDFVLLAFRAAYDVGLPWRSIKQTTGLQNLDVSHYLTHAWPVPTIEDQRAISADLMLSLDRTRSAQALLTCQVDRLLERRQALITAAVTGELDIPGVAA